MVITETYLGAVQGRYRCLFYLLLQDYIDDERLAREGYAKLFERLARDLKQQGGLVRPFPGDIESVNKEVHEKDWTEGERRTLQRTPGLLMLNVDFASFNPRFHNWVYLSLRDSRSHFVSPDEVEVMLSQVAKIIVEGENDIFGLITEVVRESHLPGIGEVFELKPGIFGCSINLIRAKDVLLTTFGRLLQHRPK
jgi:hypothetical protein